MSRRRGPEGKLQDKCTKFLRDNQIMYKKRDTSRFTAYPGWPDLDIFPGVDEIIFVELKAPGEGPTPIQAHVHKNLREKRYHVYVIDNYGAFCAIITRLCKL